MVLRLWVAVRMLCKSERILGKEKLEIKVLDKTHPMAGNCPIPPVVRGHLIYLLPITITTFSPNPS